MRETLQLGLSPEQNEEAKHLYSKHKSSGKYLISMIELMEKGDAAREKVAQAWQNGTFEEIPHEEAVFANGELTQRSMLNVAQDSHDVNMWRGHQFKQENLDKMREQAVIDAKEDGVEVKS